MRTGDTAGDRLMALILTETDADSDTIDEIVTELRNVEAEARQAERDRIDVDRLVLEIESFMEPMGTEDAAYWAGKLGGFKLAIALIREHAHVWFDR